MPASTLTKLAILALGVSAAALAAADCGGPPGRCAELIRKHATEFNATCKAGACVGPTDPSIPNKDDEVRFIRGLVLAARHYGVSGEALLAADKRESAEAAKAAKPATADLKGNSRPATK